MNTFSKNIVDIYGDRGINWLTQLPNLTRDLEVLWSLSELQPVDNLSYNYVLKGTQNNKPIILKISLDIEGLKRESKALNYFAGINCAKILAEIEGALLLECAVLLATM